MKIIKRIALTVLASAISIVLLSSCLKSEINEAMNDAEVYISTDETLDLCIYNIDTLNPLKTSAKQNAEVLSLLYDSLFIVSSDFTAIPSLCESFAVSKDGLVCTAKIKNGVYFQNGKKLTSLRSSAFAWRNAWKGFQAPLRRCRFPRASRAARRRARR